jgi:hypothetical protein
MRYYPLKLYFGNSNTTATTLLLIGLLGFIGYSIWHRDSVQFWGLRSLFLVVYGVTICCFATVRDGLDKTIQCAIDGSCAPGIFPLVSVPNIAGCIGAALILFAAIATIFSKSQHMRQIWFYVMSGGVMLKVLTLEIARILL